MLPLIIFYLGAIITGLCLGCIARVKKAICEQTTKEYNRQQKIYEQDFDPALRPDRSKIEETFKSSYRPKLMFDKITFTLLLITGLILGICINVNNGVGVSGVFIAIIELVCVILLIKSLTNFKKFFFNISEKFQKEFFDENSPTAPKKAKLLTGAVFGLFAILLIAIPISVGISSTFSLDFVGIVTICTFGALLIIIALFILYGFLWILYKLIDIWIDWIKS